MAWRPTRYLMGGDLDNTAPGKVTGWMRFAGLSRKVTFDLEGNFHRDIRGAMIRFRGVGCEDDPEAVSFMDGFALKQTGKVGDMTAGRSPHDYGRTPYLEAYTDQNGRIVLELDPDQRDHRHADPSVRIRPHLARGTGREHGRVSHRLGERPQRPGDCGRPG